MNTSILRGLGLIGTASALAVPTFAQSGAEEDEFFELSPFTVNAEEDQGYRAQNTLSGTRLKSSLTDVGASISVMTKDLLEDIGATDITDAFLYSTNTENEDEFASDDTEGISITTTNSNRVRGISSSTYSRGFFDTNVRGDSYNIERFTMAYGPNAILYGLGSPAGIVNSSTKRGSFARDFGEVGFRFDTEDGHRVTFDYNKVLAEEKFAIRIAAMDQAKKSWKQPDVDEETRFYGTFTARPFEKTTLRYSYESMENLRRKGRSQMPNQSVQTWLDNGRPLYDHINDRLTYDNGATWQDAPTMINSKGNTVVDNDALYAMGINRGAGSYFRLQINSGDEIDPSAWNAIEDPIERDLYAQNGIQAMRWRGTALSTGRSNSEDRRDPLATDSLLPRDYSISGLANFADLSSDTHSVFLEQKVNENLYFELAYNQEVWKQHSFDPIRGANELRADVNYYLPTIVHPLAAEGSIAEPNRNNGTLITNGDGNPAMVPNPNAGYFYVEGRGIGYTQEQTFDTFRFTASYEMDFTERNPHFGKHALALLYQTDDKEVLYNKTRHYNEPDFYVRAPDHNDSDVLQRYYIDPPVVGTNGATRSAYPVGFTTEDASTWATTVGTRGEGTATLRKLEGKMAVFQSRWLNNRLITTFGFREDKEETYQNIRKKSGELPFDTSYPEVPDELTYPVADGTTQTTGAVYKANDWLRIFYNKSDSFQPQSNLHDYFNNPVPPADGVGEDIGFMLDLMDGKFFARASWFNQTATGALELDWTYEIMKWRLVNNTERDIEEWSAIIPERQEWAAERGLSVDDVFRPEIGDNLRSIRDFESKGMELELIAKPISNLDLRLTFAKNESVNTRTLPNLQAYVNERFPIWEKYETLTNNPGSAKFIPDPADPSQDKYGNALFDDMTRGEKLAHSNSIGYNMYIKDTGLSRLEFAKQEEGSTSARARKYRANFIANYRFSDGKMKGFGIGTGVRYRSKAAIGYEGKLNPLMLEVAESEPELAEIVDPEVFLTADVTKPIYGDDLVDIDAWMNYRKKFSFAGRDMDWRIQMNIYNLLDDDDPLARSSYYDGSVRQYTLRSPRRIAVTNTFKF
ncbi:TonB-dependent receptor plug domain-containing protein [Pelagicoccus mobilis]|uniref:TonB-dependent receptor plug domain-containing protein n=1 Tax=Pelagicoccus mobilis TaxID=415221 RepID=A0A934RUS6_9BACT|nr:TonB-dependent receptor plug domain-containing protein [Pelagicoccus mobilis]MBK1875221.1 hypothetical protein [Pelagicoccus mobilis]